MNFQKTLSELGLTVQSGENLSITGITQDSRTVQAGFLFAALPGVNSHGISFASLSNSSWCYCHSYRQDGLFKILD